MKQPSSNNRLTPRQQTPVPGSRPTRHRARRPWNAGLALAATLFAALIPQALWASEGVAWRRVSCTTQASEPGFLFACGQHGTYLMESPGAQPGHAGATGGSASSECTVAAGRGALGAFVEPAPRPAEAPPYPCEDGACFFDLESCSAPAEQRPWTAVLDWDGWHGRTQAAMIEQHVGSSQDIGLYDLPSALLETPLADLAGVTDLHVLAGLCKILDAADAGDRAPEVLSMSFGRSTCGAETSDDPFAASLHDEITQVLEALRGRHGTVPVAALGNHRGALFPASSKAVKAVGAIDLASWSQPGSLARPSWETPEGADALLPASGLCLPFVGSSGFDFWHAPAGASYATSFFAGWLADSLANGALAISELETHGRWHPAAEETVASFVLARDGSRFASTWSAGASNLLSVLSDGEHPCWRARDDSAEAVSATLIEGDPLASLPSREELECTDHVRTPATDYCVPCIGGGTRTSGGGGGSGGNGKTELGDDGGPFIIDLSAPGIRDSGVSIDRVLLRSGDDFLELQLSGDQLERLESGQLPRLAVFGQGGRAPDLSDTSRSLVWVLRLATDQRYWSSSPIHSPQ
ncbi:MAG: hypothetical protein AAGM22_12355 [Acidobacteriota bacterium]